MIAVAIHVGVAKPGQFETGFESSRNRASRLNAQDLSPQQNTLVSAGE